MYLGWVRARVLGATLVAVCFVLPSWLMVLALSLLYVRYGGLAWMQGAFYGIGAAVIAIIARSSVKRGRLTVQRDRLLWGIFAVMMAVTAWTATEIIWLVLACGVLALLGKAPRRLPFRSPAAAVAPAWLLGGLGGVASLGAVGTLLLYFAEAGAFVFGSGLAIIPFLHGGVVDKYHWLTERQFVDDVAVAMITPGPVVITVGVNGYLIAGLPGAAVAAFATFLPCYLLTIIPAPSFRKHGKRPGIVAFVDGVTAAAIGAITGAVIVLGKRSIVEVPTVAIMVVSVLALWKFRKLPEPLVVAAAAAAGLALHPAFA
jgi:chromate transporter